MSDDDHAKPGIPAWQRANQLAQLPDGPSEEKSDMQIEKASTPPSTEEGTPADTTVSTPAGAATGVFKASDFENFKQQQHAAPTSSRLAPSRQQQSQPKQASGPPIIMYPENLVEAHKPPPLITPSRILTAGYVAGGFAALLYGASKYLIQPMSDSLTDARHEFAAHSQSKVDEMNERLEKLVSKVPNAKKAQRTDDDEADEIESVTSDPTELYHRDMGTQTSPPASRRSSSSDEEHAAEKKDTVEYQSNGLDIIKSHLNEMLERSEKVETANKDRQDSVNKLRHDLDTMMYASPSINVWNSSLDLSQEGKDSKEPDMIEDLKKEIRGVKGVLLSAKRFPGVSAKAGA